MGSSEITKLMEECGPVLDVQVIKDKFTGSHKGCSFVIFEKIEDSNAAIERFHNKHILEGMSVPMQVKPAYTLSAVRIYV